MTANLNLRSSAATISLLVSVLVLGAVPFGTSAQADPPQTIQLTGTVRDFRRAHPDFNVTPLGGNGHYAMNVALDLGPEDRPTFRGTGFRVDAQWRDDVSNPIAPHLYGGGVGLVKLVGAPTIGGGTTVDTWDSSAGPYGGPNVGPAPIFYPGAEMPTIEAPTDMGPSVGNVTYSGIGITTLSSDLHCDRLRIRDGHILRIRGDITILCETLFDMRDSGSLEFRNNSSLTLYTMGAVSFQDASVNSDTYDPSVFTLYHLGDTDIQILDGAQVYATVVATNAGMDIPDDADFYGTYTGQTLSVTNLSGFHLDDTMPLDVCGFQFNDTKGTAGIASTGGISSSGTFDQWYRDILGSNLSANRDITLTRTAAGVYEYLSDTFYPIDGALLGNEGDAHNNYFTFAFKVEFIYTSCVGQFFEFEGNDDAWLFVDGNLGIDLGGLVAGTGQYLDFDRMDLQDGQTYELHFFYAHRQPLSPPVFHLRTNVEFMGGQTSTASAVFD